MEEDEFMEPSFGEMMDLIKQYEDAEKENRKVFFDEENYDHIVQFYQDNREYNKALRVANTAMEQYPFSSVFYTKKAEILANQKRFDEALPLLEEAERLDPNDINIFLIRADVHLWEGRHAEAMEVIESAIAIATEKEDMCELLLEMADIWEDQEKYVEVVTCLKNALRHDPMCEEALNRLWFCTELMGTHDESIMFYENLLEESPYSHWAWYNLGHAYSGIGLYDKAIDALGYAIAIDDNFEPAIVSSGDVMFITGNTDKALEFYQEAIKISRPDKELYLKTAACYEKLGELGKSRSYLRKAIAVDPYYEEAFFRIGETYRMEDNLDKAIASFERAVKLSKDNVDYLIALADAYLVVGENDKALEIFERIFQQDPDSKQNWVNLASAYFNVENYRKAFQVLSEAEHKFDGSADIYYVKTVFYYQAGNRHEALINLEKGLLANFDEHTMIFEMDESLLDVDAVLQVIEQYRP
ncbi:MAG: tetratricopeptide repeat protein [Bacteroidetes bacterium]|nr:tetratricopeptide repeat protein [Bacteroidota bacterium]